MTPMNNAEYLTHLQNSHELEELKKAKKISFMNRVEMQL